MTNPDLKTTLVFDWGDTLMRVFPEYNGAMVGWPEVAGMPGAVEALTRLHEEYALFVATNAAHSSADEISAALQRVGLDGFFEDIFTSQKLDGFRKPDTAYFQAIEHCLGKPAASLVMIGDDYGVDVLGAYRVGWQTLWFNPDCAACPGLTPLHNGEIYHMGDLPEVLEDLSLPGWNTCLSWMLEQTTSHNLVQHVQTVAAAAYQIAIWLRAAGEKVKPILAQRGGLLHDLAKLSSKTGVPAEENHGERAARLLYSYNQPELAEIARRHLLFSIGDSQSRPETWEQISVYFADKLVEGATLVSLARRLEALQERYPRDKDRIQQAIPALENLQAEICNHLGMSPSELISNLRAVLFSGKVD
jgi:putative hydrolase of the HAD superfamily